MLGRKYKGIEKVFQMAAVENGRGPEENRANLGNQPQLFLLASQTQTLQKTF